MDGPPGPRITWRQLVLSVPLSELQYIHLISEQGPQSAWPGDPATTYNGSGLKINLERLTASETEHVCGCLSAFFRDTSGGNILNKRAD